VSVLSFLAAVDGVRGLLPRTEKFGRGGSSGLELARVRAGDSAVHSVWAGEAASRGLFASPNRWEGKGGDDGGGSDGEEDRRACIQCLSTPAASLTFNAPEKIRFASELLFFVGVI
jgi:hypothetical protein